ncbi:MAG: hypothetical protein ABEI77_09205, partial [Halorientalis sp.]
DWQERLGKANGAAVSQRARFTERERSEARLAGAPRQGERRSREPASVQPFSPMFFEERFPQ